MRKTIIIVGVVILLCILGIGLYFAFFAPKPTPGGNAQTGGTGSLPATGNQNIPGNTGSGTNNSGSGAANTPTAIGQKFGVVAAGPILDYFVSPSNIVTAVRPDGGIIQVTNGQANTINSLQIQNILSAGFSYDGKKILVSFGDPTKPQASIFDVSSRAWTPLSTGLQGPVWSPTDYRIAYSTTNSNGTETFSTLDVSKPKTAPISMGTIHAQDLAVAWPTKNQIVFYTKSSALAAGSVLNFDIQKKTLTPMILDTPGLAVVWNGLPQASGTPSALTFSVGPSGYGGYLQFVSAAGSPLQMLKLLTLPSKCDFAVTASSSYLYCGVPRDQNRFSFAHLPDDYNQMALFSSDDIYRINLTTGLIETIWSDPNQNVDVSDFKSFNNTLFFVSRYDQKLYGIQLASTTSK